MPDSALFLHPDVLKVVRAILTRYGVPTQELEDAMQDVVLACLEYVRETSRDPEDTRAAIAIVRRIATRDAIDAARKRRSRGTQNVGLTPDPDDHAQPARRKLDDAEKARILAILREEMTDEEIELLIARGAGVPHAEIAAEAGISPAASRKNAERTRKKAQGLLQARGYWTAGASFAALLGGVALIFWVVREPDNVAQSRAQYAAEQRRFAAQACHERKWDECEKALDRATNVDPEGDQAAEVKTLREMVAAARGGAARDGGGRGE